MKFVYKDLKQLFQQKQIKGKQTVIMALQANGQVWLALDIGNTNTCAAIYDSDKNIVEVLVVKGKSKQLPSVVNFANLQDYSNPVVGQIPAKL